MSRPVLGNAFVLSIVSVAALCAAAQAGDWVHWRGPSQNGASYDTGIPEKFSLDANDPKSNLLWRKPYGCRSTPLIINGRVYLIRNMGEGLNEGEGITCLDAKTGDLVWEDKFNVFLTDIVSSRVGWTNPAGDPETGNVYIHGTQGFLRCYSRDGKVIWSRSLTEEFGRVTGYGGRVVSPVVSEGLVIVGMINGSWGDFARGANRFVAFDKNNGQVAWWSALEGPIRGTYYSNPVVATINGQKLLITGGADGGLHAFQVRTGKLMWSYHFAGTVVNSSPVVDGSLVYCSHGEENEDTSEQGRLICVDAAQITDSKPKLVWEVIGTKFGYTTPVVANGTVYICNDSARLYKFDAKTGKAIGRPTPYGRLARGSPVWADGKLFVFDVNGGFHIFKEGKRGLEEVYEQKFRLLRGTGFVETNGSPAIANGRLFIATLQEMFCIGSPSGESGAVPPTESEKPAAASMGWVQLYPADVVLAAGQSAEFTVMAFDSNGVPLKEIPAGSWAIPLPPKQPSGRQPPALVGKLNETKPGTVRLTVASEVVGQQGYVEFTSGALKCRARIRVAPSVPYTMDFEKVPVGATPGGWVNAMGKFDVIEKDGSKVFRKIATNPAPPVARANAFITIPNVKGGTIQADVNGSEVRGGVPDIGLLLNRYHLLLDGKRDVDDGKRRLRISSWEAVPRLNHAVVFDWQPNSWYTIKLTVTCTDKTATVRGKVWPRGTPEPKEWTIQFEDTSPNHDGAPALYSYISNVLEKDPGAEAYFDNVSVIPN